VPTAADFDNASMLFQYCQSHAMLNGYAVSIKRSNKDWNIAIKCDFGGMYREGKKTSHLEKRRKTLTRVNNCPFELFVSIHCIYSYIEYL
jgi:alanine racemase